MVWYSHFFQNFPKFIVIHIVKGFGIVNKAEIDVFLELSCFFNDPKDLYFFPSIILFVCIFMVKNPILKKLQNEFSHLYLLVLPPFSFPFLLTLIPVYIVIYSLFY